MLIRWSTQLGAITLCLLFSVAAASGQARSSRRVVLHPTRFAISAPMSEAPSATPATRQTNPRPFPIPHAPSTPGPDGALQTAYGPLVNAIAGIQFDGVDYTNPGECAGCEPSDANIAVGPNHIVQTVNVAWAVYDKSGKIFTRFPKALGSVWAALGGACTTEVGDPVVQYDLVADRWLISQIGTTDFSTSFSECIAVSRTPDPTGSYALYEYQFGNVIQDYPKIGVWPTASNSAYLATYNAFGPNGYEGSDACAYDRTSVLAGNADATSICFIHDPACLTITASGGINFCFTGGFLPSDLDGTTPPPAGSPGYFVAFETNPTELRLYKLTPNFANPSASTFTGPTAIPVAAFSMACGGGLFPSKYCIPQSGTSQLLDSLADRLMYRLAYRNFGDHEALVTNHAVVAGSSVGERWYEIRDPDGAVNVIQQGTFAPDSQYRWMGSAAQDKVGDIAIGYSLSSSNIHPSIAYTGREPGDPAGTMQSEAIMLTGTGSDLYPGRWGDYSALRIDPADDCTFWYTAQYLKKDGFATWSTRVGSFAMNNCTNGTGGDFTITATPLKQTISKGGTTTYTVTIGAVNSFGGVVDLSVTGRPLFTNVTFNPRAVTGSGTSILTIDGVPLPGRYPLTITGTSGPLSHAVKVTLVVQPQ